MSSPTRKLGVAIHGVGDVAYAHAASWCKNPHVEIVSVSSRHPESAQQLADKFGLDCTIHTASRTCCGIRASTSSTSVARTTCMPSRRSRPAESGRHVLVEKPMVLTMDENRALRDAVAKAGVKSIVGFVLRWNPMIESLQDGAGRSGRSATCSTPRSTTGTDSGPAYRGWDWASRRATGGSAMLFGGCHAVDVLRWLVARGRGGSVGAGQQPARHFTSTMPTSWRIVKFRNGVIGKTSVLFDAKIPYTFNVDLLGTEGGVRDNRLWVPKLLPGQRQWSTFPTITPDSADVHHHPFDAQINHFVDCIRHDVESHCNVADSYHTHELCLAIDQSVAEGGRLVRLARFSVARLAPADERRSTAPQDSSD